MPPLRPGLRRSARLQAKSPFIIVSTMIPSTGVRGNPQVPSTATTLIPSTAASNPKAKQATVAPAHPTVPIPPSKRTGKRVQEATDDSISGIYWERQPHLTKKLLSWLAEHPLDRAILFNESKVPDVQGSAAKPQARRKQEIKAIIASAVFGQDTKYGEAYARQPGKFTIAVGKRLARYVFSPSHNWNPLHLHYSLKKKYRDQLSRFHTTGEGVNPSNSHFRNLLGAYHLSNLLSPSPCLMTLILEQVTSEFPYWEACHEMWHGNPAYDAKSINGAAGAKKTQDLLARLARRATANEDDPAAEDDLAAEDDPGEEGFGGVAGTSRTADLVHQPETPMDGVEEEEEEEEEFREKDGGGAEASGMAEDQRVNVPQPADPDPMSVDEELMLEDHGPAWQTHEVSHLLHPQFRN